LVIGAILVANGSIVLGTTLVDSFWRLPKPSLVGIEKAEDDAMHRNAKWSDGSMAKLIEHHLRLTSRVRKKLAKPYTEFLFRSLRETGKTVMAGREGMLFLKERIQTPKAPPELGATREAAVQGAISRRLAALGMRHILVPVPRKGVVCQANLPMGVDARRAFDEAVVPAMRARGVECVDLLPALEGQDPTKMYLRVDTHWSTQGMQRSAEAVAAQTGLLAPLGERRGHVREVPAITTAPVGDLPVLMGIQLRESDAPTYNCPMVEVVGDRLETMPLGDASSPIALCGTSFSGHGLFASFLSHYFGIAVDSHAILGGTPHASLAEMLHAREASGWPEVVIEEIPNHLVQAMALNVPSWVVFQGAGDLFASFPPPHTVDLPVWDKILATSAPLGTPLAVVDGRVAAEVGPGWLGRSGEGALEFVIDGELTAGEVRLDLGSDKALLSIPWSTGRKRVVVPALSEQASSEPIRLVIATLTPEASFVLHDFHPVISAAPSTVEAGSVSPLEAKGGGFEQSIAFPPGLRFGRHDTLVVHTTEGRESAEGIELVVETTAGDRAVFPFQTLHPNAWIVVQPGAFAGSELADVRVSGRTASGQPLASFVQSAAWYRLSVKPLVH